MHFAQRAENVQPFRYQTICDVLRGRNGRWCSVRCVLDARSTFASDIIKLPVIQVIPCLLQTLTVSQITNKVAGLVLSPIHFHTRGRGTMEERNHQQHHLQVSDLTSSSTNNSGTPERELSVPTQEFTELA